VHDIRFVFATLTINFDLERFGDYAEGIAKLVISGKKGFDKDLIEKKEIKEMYKTQSLMLQDVITAYAEGDSKLARSVFSKDLQIKDINHNAFKIIID
jgi:phosphate transport system protein